MKGLAVRKENNDNGRKTTLGNQVLLTEQQASEIMQLTPRALQSWRLRGGGPRYIRISGRCIRYKREHLDEWIAARVRTSTSDPGRPRSEERDANV